MNLHVQRSQIHEFVMFVHEVQNPRLSFGACRVALGGSSSSCTKKAQVGFSACPHDYACVVAVKYSF